MYQGLHVLTNGKGLVILDNVHMNRKQVLRIYIYLIASATISLIISSIITIIIVITEISITIVTVQL